MKNIFKKIDNIIKIIFYNKFLKVPDFSEKRIFLQGKLLSELNRNKEVIDSFKDVEFSVFSQFGEDGIISWLVNNVPNIKKIFLEIGTQDYWESNTRFLLKLENWKGYLVEASSQDIKKIKSQGVYWRHNLRAINEFINIKNVNEIIKKNIKEEEIGLLSLDIDGNDYWILNEINTINPTIVVCEFNSVFGDIHKITSIYDENFKRSEKHYSNLYFGCSIQALISLMKDKKYTFLGTSSQGINAFFIKEEQYKYIEKKIVNKNFHPSNVREARDKNFQLNYKNIIDNLNLIIDMEVYDIEKKIKQKISNYKEIFSSDWKNKIK